MSLLKSKKDKELFAKWNKKLDQFDDCNAEDFSKSDVPLKRWARWFTNVPAEKYDETTQYFETARALLHTHQFKTAWHRKVWALHSEGYSGNEIARMINNRFSRPTVNIMINLTKKQAGIK